mmetsp:Transcript_81923/g.231893  ORF Transcript_81923/g.231893 Transcript_81923/m.231893 type:complete len:472 (+) Transcript_81923:3-1418(+)
MFWERADIFLTSYGTLRSDARCLMERQSFSAMVLDEAQAIKNFSSQVSRAAKCIAAEVPVRVAISGTPIENRLSDLHSLFDYVMPGYLGSRATFEATYGRPLGPSSADDGKVAASLQRLTGNFLLRRMKTDPAIADDLPPKVEQSHVVDLTPEQAKLYSCILEECMNPLGILGSCSGGGGGPSVQRTLPALLGRCRDLQSSEPLTDKPMFPSGPLSRSSQEKCARVGNVFRMLHALRQICNHPSNLDFSKWPDLECLASSSSSVEASGKTQLLQVLLEQIFAQGEKAVIFCQYLKTVDMLASQIRSRFPVTVQTLVGELSVDERARCVRAFQESDGPGAMVLTLGVGGTGITLHAASHVVHFDRCYNPARESQGSDRVHRIGQRASCVFVHRFVSRGTFEERVDRILERKSRICGMVAPGGEGWIAGLGDSELRELFGGRPRPADVRPGPGCGPAKRRRTLRRAAPAAQAA